MARSLARFRQKIANINTKNKDGRPGLSQTESVTKQPTLPDFPRTIFATAKRREQARIRAARQHAVAASCGGYAQLFGDVLPPAFLEKIDPTPRKRHFGHVPVLWAWMGQVLEANASCSKGLGLVQAWCRDAGLPEPGGDTGGYCQARMRLSEEFLDSVHHEVCRKLNRTSPSGDRWKGMRLKAIDGSSVTLADTSENQALYPQHSSSKPGCGFPIMGIVGVVDLGHGGWEGFATCIWKEHDARVAPRALKYISKGDLLLADRGFCSYELLYRTTVQREAHALFRLHQSRERVLDWRKGKRISRNERLVTWKKPISQSSGSTLDKKDWDALPNEMQVRYIKCPYKDRGGKSGSLVVVTNLLNPSTHPGDELIELYRLRWDIEVRLRDIKTTLKMERFAVGTPKMAHKTLKVMMLAYNLIRVAMQRAAAEAGLLARQMSFKGALDVVNCGQGSLSRLAGKPRLIEAARQAVIASCAARSLNIRPGRHEPRAIKTRPKNHQLLTRPRHEFKEVQHRETCYRKTS